MRDFQVFLHNKNNRVDIYKKKKQKKMKIVKV